MIREQITAYIAESHETGIPYEQVRGWLVASGWSPQDVDDTYSSLYPGKLPGKLAGHTQRLRQLGFGILLLFLFSLLAVLLWPGV